MLRFSLNSSPQQTLRRDAKLTRSSRCVRCGRFCLILYSTERYNGQGTQLYVTFGCSRCGTYTESMW